MTSTDPMAQVCPDPDFQELKEHVIRETGLAYYLDKENDLVEKVGVRLKALRLPHCKAYLNLLKEEVAGTAELDELVCDLTIGETYFFRHQEQFDALKEIILPELIRKNKNEKLLRIWSAGCSIGAEPYSVAMLLKREFGDRIAGWNVEILGTDINRRFLAKAQEGVFQPWSLRGLPDDLRQACFTSHGTIWSIHPEYKEWVHFQYHNLAKNPFPSLVNNLFAFDLILCRNVIIYFNGEASEKIVGQFAKTLKDGGWYLGGYAEIDSRLYRPFQTVQASGAVAYRKSSAVRPAELPSFQAGEHAGDAAWAPPDLSGILVPKRPAGVSPSAYPRNGAGISDIVVRIREAADRGDWPLASSLSADLIKRDKFNPRGYFYDALIQEHMGHGDVAEEQIKKAIYLDRTFILAHYHYGLLLHKKRKTPSAGRCFRNALKLLSQKPRENPIEDADGITAGELIELTEMHLEILEA